jgi:hypothetical protein
MGLDTVELIVAFEKHFQISIPDQEAEKIGTVGEAAACVTQLRGLLPDPIRTAAYHTVLQQVLSCLQPEFPTVSEVTRLAALWPAPSRGQATRQLANCLELEVPPLPKLQPPLPPATWLPQLLQIRRPAPPEYFPSTVADLTEWIVAQNYARLLPAPTTLYEAQRVMVGLTSYYSGVPVPEIRLSDSFTNDLGMD